MEPPFNPRDAVFLPCRGIVFLWGPGWEARVPLPLARVGEGGAPFRSVPPGAAGRQWLSLGTRGRPCPARPTRARPAAAGFPEPRKAGRLGAGGWGGVQPGAEPTPWPEPGVAEASRPTREGPLRSRGSRQMPQWGPARPGVEVGVCARTQRSLPDLTAPCPLSLPGCRSGSGGSGSPRRRVAPRPREGARGALDPHPARLDPRGRAQDPGSAGSFCEPREGPSLPL